MNARPKDFAGAQPLTARQRLELEIERLIALLDAFDGDAELEDDASDEMAIAPVTLNPERRSPTRYVRRPQRA